jgi:hypothetical protein
MEDWLAGEEVREGDFSENERYWPNLDLTWEALSPEERQQLEAERREQQGDLIVFRLEQELQGRSISRDLIAATTPRLQEIFASIERDPLFAQEGQCADTHVR